MIQKDWRWGQEMVGFVDRYRDANADIAFLFGRKAFVLGHEDNLKCTSV
jgi:hypothetical protein